MCDDCRGNRSARASTSGGSSSKGGGFSLSGCLALLFLFALVYGIGRVAGCNWAKSTAEKGEGKEISWDVKAELEPGRRYSFTCPAGGAPGDVTGTDFYLAKESSICAAAAHAGAVDTKLGGRVTIEVQERKGVTFVASTRHGITSKGETDSAKAADAGTEPDSHSEVVFLVVKTQ